MRYFYVFLKDDITQADKLAIANKVKALVHDVSAIGWGDLKPWQKAGENWRGFVIDNDGRKFGLNAQAVRNWVLANISTPGKVDLVTGNGIQAAYDAGYSEIDKWW